MYRTSEAQKDQGDLVQIVALLVRTLEAKVRFQLLREVLDLDESSDLHPDEEEILEHTSELAHHMALIWGGMLTHACAQTTLSLGEDLIPQKREDLLSRMEESFSTFALSFEEIKAVMREFLVVWFSSKEELVLPGRILIRQVGNTFSAHQARS